MIVEFESESVLHELSEPQSFTLPGTKRKVRLRVYHEYTFPDTGETIRYRKVNLSMRLDAQSSMEGSKPEPPVEVMRVAGQEQEFANKDDPQYVQALQKWTNGVDDLFAKMALKYAIIYIENENWQDDVKEYRASMKEVGAAVTEKDDLLLWLNRIASGSQEGLNDFTFELMRRSRPSADEVQRNIESFRPAGHPGGNGAIIQAPAVITHPDRR